MKKTILLTGATSGIGRAAALEFVKQGHKLLFLARNSKKAQSLISEALNLGYGSMQAYQCDLASQASVKKFAQQLKSEYQSIDILIHNAGLWNSQRIMTEDNIESTLAVNVLAPFLLTRELIDLVDAGSDKRIIFTASALHRGTIHFDDMQFKKSYTGFLAYQHSKLAVILLTKYLARELKEKNIHVNCLHPGVIASNLANNNGVFSKLFFKLIGKSPEKGAETLVYLALNDEIKSFSGEYFANKKIVKSKGETYNMEMAERLIKELEKMVL